MPQISGTLMSANNGSEIERAENNPIEVGGVALKKSGTYGWDPANMEWKKISIKSGGPEPQGEFAQAVHATLYGRDYNGGDTAVEVSVDGSGNLTTIQRDEYGQQIILMADDGDITTNSTVAMPVREVGYNAGTDNVTSQSRGTAILHDVAGTFELVSDANPLQVVEERPTTTLNTTIADTDTSTLLVWGNTSRFGCTIYNDSSAALYVLLGEAAVSTTLYTIKIASGGYYEVPFNYTGKIYGVWASNPNDGSAHITEFLGGTFEVSESASSSPSSSKSPSKSPSNSQSESPSVSPSVGP